MPHIACQAGHGAAAWRPWSKIDTHRGLRPLATPEDRSRRAGLKSASDYVIDSITLSGEEAGRTLAVRRSERPRDARRSRAKRADQRCPALPLSTSSERGRLLGPGIVAAGCGAAEVVRCS